MIWKKSEEITEEEDGKKLFSPWEEIYVLKAYIDQTLVIQICFENRNVELMQTHKQLLHILDGFSYKQ